MDYVDKVDVIKYSVIVVGTFGFVLILVVENGTVCCCGENVYVMFDIEYEKSWYVCEYFVW